MAKQSKAELAVIETAIKRLKIAVDSDDHNRVAGIEDLKFANGEQWDQKEKKRRSDKGRPALTLNFLPKFIDQVVGDMLHNAPSIKLHPVDSRADISIAKIRQGIIDHIQYQSNAKGIYGYAGKQMVSGGYGGWRVLTRYTEENPFMQEAYLKGIRNPFLIYMDPSSTDQNYADAKWGFLLEKMPQAQFTDKWPKATLPTDAFKSGKGLGAELWYDKEAVMVAEYFVRETEPRMMFQLEDGRVCTEDEYKELKERYEEQHSSLMSALDVAPAPQAPSAPQSPQGGVPSPQQLPTAGAPSMGAPASPPSAPAPTPSQGSVPPAPPNPLLQQVKSMGEEPKIAKRRETEVTVIRHYILTCLEVLSGGAEGKKFPGKYIPLVLLKGKELNIEGKNFVSSLIRHAKDPQKLINYWNTCAAETIAMAPKAPWLGTAKQFEGYENDYAGTNVENFPMLKYNVDAEAPGPPQRQQPGAPPVAMFEQIRRGEDNLKSVLGMFNADVGAPVSQQTGAAVNAVQRSGDIGTFEFMENLARAVMHTGRILNEIIPEIYDTERDVRVRNIDESESFVPINTTLGAAMKSVEQNPERFKGLSPDKLHSMFAKDGKDAKFNDITAGKYDVVVSTGPSYATQRQESAQHLLQLIQSNPQQMSVGMDLVVEAMDFKDASELAARLRKPLVLAGITKPRPGEAPPTPPPPAPKVLIEQAKLQMQQLKIQQETVRLEHEKIKTQLEMAKLQAQKAEQPGAADNTSELQETAMKLQLEIERLDQEKKKFEHEAALATEKLVLEREKFEAEVEAKSEERAIKREEIKGKAAAEKKDPLKIRKGGNK